MTRILHLSDLHFGFHRTALVDVLLARVNGLGADLIVVTGDVTHRGRPGQFEMAADFLSRLTSPVMVVPGNHDVPLYNIPVRFLWPYAGYRRAIDTDLSPVRAVGRGSGQVRVLGVNSVDPFSWQCGVLRPAGIENVIGGLDPLAINIVALHHPMQHTGLIDKELARNAPAALTRFAAAGVHVVLSGHLHLWAAEDLLRDDAPNPLLQIQAGSALCARLGDLQNEFAVLDFDDTDLTLSRHIAPMSAEAFEPPIITRLSRVGGSWRVTAPPGTRPAAPAPTREPQAQMMDSLARNLGLQGA